MARGKGEGSIYKRDDGQWTGSIDLGRGQDGKRRRKVIYGKTRKEVIEKMQALQAEQLKGGIIETTKLTVEQYMERWLTDVVAHTVKPVTAESYRMYVRVHILPIIGSLQLAKIQPMHLQQLYSGILNAGKQPRTAQYVHTILHSAFDQAVRWGMINRNPAAAVKAPKPARKEMMVLTSDQVQTLVETMTGDPLYALYYLAIATGCRRGELVALRWQDIDWKRPSISINRTAEQVGNEVVFTEPKTAKSRRLIPLPAEALAVLKAHRTRQLRERVAQEIEYVDQGLVFAKPDGQPLIPGYVTQHFAILVKRAGIPKIRLHDLRHTHATLLLAADVHPKVVSERLGHSSVTITLDTYSHVLPTMQAEVTRKLDALLPTAKPHAV